MSGYITSCSCCDWAILGLSLAAIVYLYLTWTFNYWKKRGVPFVQPTMLFGNLKDNIMGKKSLGVVYQDVYKALDGHTYGGFFKFRQPALMIRDPDLLKLVLVKEFSSFHDNDFQVTVDDDPMLGRNPFVREGEAWKTVRSQLTPAFTAAKVRPLLPLINDVCQSLKTYLEKNVKGTDGTDAKEVSAMFTTDVVATCVFGLEGNSFTDPNAAFRAMGKKIFSPSFWQNAQQLCIILLPSVARLFKFKFFDKTVADFFLGVVTQAMSYRESNNVTRNDFLQLLMQLKAKGHVEGDATTGPQREKFTDLDCAAHATTFFTDGFETSSTTMAFALYELALNPDVMERVREEVDAALLANGGKFNYEMVQGMTYLDMIMDETMRRHSIVPQINRICTKPFDLPSPDGGALRVEVGTSVVIPVLGLHEDPKYYPEPERFDPERFSEGNKEARHKCVYLPFGEGPRICLGIRFAQIQVKAGLATIISNFDIKINKRTEVPIVPDPQFFILSAKGGIWLDFTKRTDK